MCSKCNGCLDDNKPLVIEKERRERNRNANTGDENHHLNMSPPPR